MNSVLGPVQTADLDFTLMHEHIGTNAAGLRNTYPEFIDRSGIIEQSSIALKEAYDEGLRTMVDVSTFDLGRDVKMIQEVSRRSGVPLGNRRYRQSPGGTPSLWRSLPGRPRSPLHQRN